MLWGWPWPQESPVLTGVAFVPQVPLLLVWGAAFRPGGCQPVLVHWVIPSQSSTSWFNSLMSLPAHLYILSRSFGIAALQRVCIFVDTYKGTVSKQLHYQGNNMNSFYVLIIDRFYVLTINGRLAKGHKIKSINWCLRIISGDKCSK